MINDVINTIYIQPFIKLPKDSVLVACGLLNTLKGWKNGELGGGVDTAPHTLYLHYLLFINNLHNVHNKSANATVSSVLRVTLAN